MSAVYYTTFESPVGPLLLAGESSALRRVSFENGKRNTPPRADWKLDKEPFAEVIRQFLNVYLNEEDIRFLGGESCSLKEGDRVLLVPSIAGGC